MRVRGLVQAIARIGFIRNVAVLAGGTVLARLLSACASPILTRLYSPSDFGALAVFFSAVTAAVLVSALNYDQAIPVPKEDDVAVGLVLLAFCLLLINTALLALAVGFFSRPIAKALGAPALAKYLFLLPFSVLGGGAFYILNSWGIRAGAFVSLSKRRVWQSVAQVVVQVTTPLLTRGPIGLLLGDSVGRAAGSATLMKEFGGYVSQRKLSVTIHSAQRAAMLYWRYPTYGLAALVLHTGLSVIPPLLLAIHFGLAVTGSYNLVSQVIGVGSSVVGLSVAQVHFSKAAGLARTDPSGLFTLFLKTSGTCAALAALPFLCLGYFGPVLFRYVFGVNWTQAGEFGRILAVPYFVIFVVGPVFPVLTILQRQHWQLIVDGSGLLLMIGLVLAAARLGLGAQHAVAAYAIAMTITYVGLYIAAGIAIHCRSRSPLSSAHEEA